MLRALAITVLFLALAQCLVAEQCAPDKHNPCIASCNGTTFDISKLFHYPHNISGPYGEFYIWSPCKGYEKCGTQTENCAVCQSGCVNCGQYLEPIFILEQTDPYIFRIEYTSGTTWRISFFQFIVSEIHPETKATYIGEEWLQYNFQVTGKCLGQPGCLSSGPNPFH